MALTPGTRLGVYDVTAPIGEGGMGQVYRARDTKLGRDVALKILPDAVAQDSDRLARFKREAQVLAALNHPHIAAIYGFDEAGTTQFLILELVEGETLADRLKRGPIPVDETIVIARQIAEALEEAHEKGIIHRDLKPANVAFTAKDQVKVLDFGLAKLAARPAGAAASSASMSPTLTTPAMTAMGMILGTAAYMAPEQAKGREADKRSDLWAFGCVVFEMLTAKRAFEGEDITDTIASIMRGEPDWKTLPAETPGNLRQLLELCLTKDRRQRAADIAVAQFLLGGGSAAGLPAPVIAQRKRQERTIWIAGAVALAAIASAATWLIKPAPAVSTPVRHVVIPIPQTLDFGYGNVHFALSPDGSRLVYRAREDGGAQLYVRALDADTVTSIAHTENALHPIFSPDSRWIVFRLLDGLVKIPAEGGLPIVLDRKRSQRGITWTTDDHIVFVAAGTGGIGLGSLWSIPAAGGPAALIADPDGAKGEGALRSPEALPDGSVLFHIDRSDSSDIAVLPKGRGPARVLMPNAVVPKYVAPGFLVFARLATLFAVPFDVAHLTVTGTPVPVLDGVNSSDFSVSPSGALAYVAGTVQPLAQSSLTLVDARSGHDTTLNFKPGAYAGARFSPDGRSVAVGIQTRQGEQRLHSVWTGDLTRAILTPLTNDGAGFSWTPDGRHVAFRTSAGDLAWRARDLSDQPKILVTAADLRLNPGSPTWSPDGATLLVHGVRTQATGQDLWTLTGVSSGHAEVHAFVEAAGNQSNPAFSADGRWVAYADGGRIDARPFPGPGPVATIVEGGGPLRWRGKTLFFVKGRQVMAVDIATSPTVTPSTPRVVYALPAGATLADVAPDGQRLLVIVPMAAPPPEPPPHEIHLIINWIQELKQKMGAGNS